MSTATDGCTQTSAAPYITYLTFHHFHCTCGNEAGSNAGVDTATFPGQCKLHEFFCLPQTLRVYVFVWHITMNQRWVTGSTSILKRGQAFEMSAVKVKVLFYSQHPPHTVTGACGDA